jgi:hypothetical protein
MFCDTPWTGTRIFSTDWPVVRDQRQSLGLGLCDQNAVERILVQHRYGNQRRASETALFPLAQFGR